MIKIKAYPTYSYSVFLVISIVLLIMGLLPFIIKTDDNLLIRAIWSIIMFCGSFVFLIYTGYLKQSLVIEKDIIKLRNLFGKMIEINIKEIDRIEIQNLITYQSWAANIFRKWICIYTRYCNEKFTHGIQNKKSKRRIQIIYDEKLYNYLSELIK